MNESNPKILEGFSKDAFTTDLVDEFVEGDYDYLALGNYHFATSVYDEKQHLVFLLSDFSFLKELIQKK